MNTFHCHPDNIDKSFLESQLRKYRIKEFPINFIISLRDVEFESHTWVATFLHGVDDLMGSNDNIKNLLAQNKASLRGVDAFIKERFDSFDNNFRENFID